MQHSEAGDGSAHVRCGTHWHQACCLVTGALDAGMRCPLAKQQNKEGGCIVAKIQRTGKNSAPLSPMHANKSKTTKKHRSPEFTRAFICRKLDSDDQKIIISDLLTKQAPYFSSRIFFSHKGLNDKP